MTRTHSLGFGAISVLLVAAMLWSGPSGLSAQSDPSSLPLLTENSLQYLGGFRLPAGQTNGD